MRQKNNIPADAGNFLRTEKDSKDFKNEKLSTKIRRDETQKPYFLKENIPKRLETMQIFCYQVLTDTESSSI